MKCAHNVHIIFRHEVYFMVSTYIYINSTYTHLSMYMPNNSCWSAFNYYLLLVQFLPPSLVPVLFENPKHARTHAHTGTLQIKNIHIRWKKILLQTQSLVSHTHIYMYKHIVIVLCTLIAK